MNLALVFYNGDKWQMQDPKQTSRRNVVKGKVRVTFDEDLSPGQNLISVICYVLYNAFKYNEKWREN